MKTILEGAEYTPAANTNIARTWAKTMTPEQRNSKAWKWIEHLVEVPLPIGKLERTK